MLHHVLHVLKFKCFLDFDRPVVLGVSGGSDSLYMLRVLHELGIRIIVTHFNHHMREEANREAEKVQRWVADLGLPFIYGERQLEGGGVDLISEEKARQFRYEFLFHTAQANQAQAVAVAHTADDQVETVLLHLLRGSGLTGLTGMAYHSLPNAWSREIPLIRPLLATWRHEIDVFIEEKKLSPNIDHSNFDTTFIRNRVRQELIPYLQTYSPQVKRLIWQMAEILTDEETMIEDVVDEAWVACFIQNSGEQVELRADAILSHKVNIQRRLVRKAISLLIPSLRDIDYGIIDRFITLSAKNKNYHDADLGEGFHLFKQGNRVVLFKGQFLQVENMPQLEPGKTIPVNIPGDILLLPGWQLHIEKVELNEDVRRRIVENADPFQIWLDIDSISLPLLLRTRKNGDVFCPFGMQGHHLKLSDFMINEKIPRSQREHWPVVLSNNEIVWVVGQRAGHYGQVTAETKNAVHLWLDNISKT